MKFNSILFAILATALIIHYSFTLAYNIDDYILITIAIIAILPVGWRTVLAFKNKKFTVDLMVTIALVAALLGREFSAAVFIGLMLTSARMLAIYTENKARRAIQSLLKLKPKKARVKIGSEIKEIAIEKIRKGDLVIAELGERIPVDGVIVDGEAAVDQSSLTGESLPVDKKIGDIALSSTNIVSGNLTIRAEKVGKETTLEKIINLVEEAQTMKPKIAAFSDKLATYYSILALLGIALIYIFSHSLPLVLSVILVISAEDIAIAIPLAFVAGIGRAARRGVIIKGGDFLDGLRKVKVLLVDKTGTLTRKKMKVENIFVFDDFKLNDFLRLAADASLLSSHPSAKAILKYAEESKITPRQPAKFKEESGRGVEATISDKKIITGKMSFLLENKVKITEHQRRDIEREKDKGLNTTLIGYNGYLAGFFTLADEIRPNVKNILSQIKNLGVEKIIMLTGDNEKIAARVADQTGVTSYHANLLPEDKLKYLKKYLSKDYKVMAIGDGVNDAALLNAADIGIAMGGIGADVTIESGDIVLMQDNLSRLPELFKLSRFILRVAYQDLALWAVINGAGLLLVFGGYLLPTGAAVWNFIGDFPPLLNSVKLLRLKKEEK